MDEENYFIEKALEEEQQANKENAKTSSIVQKLFIALGIKILSSIKNTYKDMEDEKDISYFNFKSFLKPRELKEFKNLVSGYKKDIEKDDSFTFLSKYEDSISNSLLSKYDYLLSLPQISRETKLITQVEFDVSKVMSNFENVLNMHLAQTYFQKYDKTQFDVFKFLGEGTKIDSSYLNQDLVQKILDYPWSGEDFSDRIWKNKEKLIQSLREDLTTHFIAGDSYEATAKRVQDKLDSNYFDAYRVIQTESSRVLMEADKDAHEDMGLKKYKILATLDSRTSEICREEDGEIYQYKDMVIGKNAPPFHPMCRTVIVPYDEDTAHFGERIARGLDNKNYNVPSSMTYKEWHSKHIDATKEAEIIKAQAQDKRLKKEFQKLKEALGDDAPKTFTKYKNMKNKGTEDFKELRQKYNNKIKVKFSTININ